MTKGIVLLFNLLLVSFLTTGTLTGKWKLERYKDLKTGETEYEPIRYRDHGVMTFYFQDNDSSGTFKGRTLSNETQGEYLLMPDNKIKVTSFGGTKIREPEWGGKFFEKYL